MSKLAVKVQDMQTETLGHYCLPAFIPNPKLEDHYRIDYQKWVYKIWEMPDQQAVHVIRELVQNDLFFLLYYVMNRKDINTIGKPFIIERCKELASGPKTDTVDLWARGHYKSSIITQGETVQDHCKDVEDTIGIFSHTRPNAKDFMLPIKTAYESSIVLLTCFPDVFWSNPRKQAPIWSMDNGLVLKRKSTSNTASLEAHGLIDGMPTGKHFKKRVYDDVVTEKSIGTEGMLEKVRNAIRLSDNLSVTDGSGRQRVVGTIYSYGDYYTEVRKQSDDGVYPWAIRVHPWYNPDRFGKETTPPIPELSDEQLDYLSVYLDAETIRSKHTKQGPYIWACQMELDPSNEEMREFKRSWLQWYQKLPKVRNKYILVDPANEKKKESDYTVAVIMSIDQRNNRYLEEMVRDRLNLAERWRLIRYLMNKHPDCKGVFYEKYGKDADISYFDEQQKLEGVYFRIEAIGGPLGKLDRIRRLIPVCNDKKFFLPIEPITYSGKNVIDTFLNEEYDPFPFCVHYDELDAISRIEDPQVGACAPLAQHVVGGIEAERAVLMNSSDIF